MTDIDLAAIEARHYERILVSGERLCDYCDLPWPCDAAVLLDALRAAEARERQRLLTNFDRLKPYLSDVERAAVAAVLFSSDATPDEPHMVRYQWLAGRLALAPTEPETERP